MKHDQADLKPFQTLSQCLPYQVLLFLSSSIKYLQSHDYSNVILQNKHEEKESKRPHSPRVSLSAFHALYMYTILHTQQHTI